MAQLNEVQAAPAPSLAGCTQGIRWVCTKNPFYVLSAGLFLLGLRVSFGDLSQALNTWALMSGLVGYTFLLAVTACLLVRYGKVWDDVRTVLLLVVLLFLATSVTFDEVLFDHPVQGLACFLGGLTVAILVSEGLLRGIRLLLPAWFCGPYYLILTLFFLYPLALTPLTPPEPRGEMLMWALFGFSTVAGLIFLTLLPAIRRGPDYLRGNGSPWPWPLYPWTLFGLLGCAVPARAYMLCWSMDFPNAGNADRLIFGPYFLVPFGLAIAVLLLEAGITSGRRGVLWAALGLPMGLIVLAGAGHRADPVYQEFLQTFMSRLGGSPLYLTMLALVALYCYAALRRVPRAAEALTAALVGLAVVGPNTLNLSGLSAPQTGPLVAAAALQLGLGLWRRVSWRCLIGVEGLVVAVALTLPQGSSLDPLRGIIVLHLGLAALLLIGALFDDAVSRLLRAASALLILAICVAVIFGQVDLPSMIPSWAVTVYPFVAAIILAGYGLLLGQRSLSAMAALVLTLWLGETGWRGYWWLRRIIVGLDYLSLSFVLFALAVLISMAKSGMISRWLAGHGKVQEGQISDG